MVQIHKGKLRAARDFKEPADLAHAVRDLLLPGMPVVMEYVHAFPGQGVVSMFTFGRWAGIAQGAALAHGAEVVQISPVEWQKWARDDYDVPRPLDFDSRLVALEHYPLLEPVLKRKKDHNTADAVLLGFCWWIRKE